MEAVVVDINIPHEISLIFTTKFGSGDITGSSKGVNVSFFFISRV